MLWLDKRHCKFGGRAKTLEYLPNNFDHYLYAYLHAMRLILPCPRGLDDFDQQVPDGDARDYARGIKAAIEREREAKLLAAAQKAGSGKAQQQQQGGGGQVASGSTSGPLKALQAVAKVPAQVMQGVAGGVRGVVRSLTRAKGAQGEAGEAPAADAAREAEGSC